MNSLFPPELRTASVVQRWSIVRTLNRDSVAEHSFFVTYYAITIANLIKWRGPLDALTFAALLHDSDEFIAGDVVSPVKHGVFDNDKYETFIEQQMNLRLPMMRARLRTIMDSEHGDTIQKIVKVADKVDAVIFLILEMRMGNRGVSSLLGNAMENLYTAWMGLANHVKLDAPDDLWNDQIYPAIQAHHNYGSIGIHD
jgi:5'-deoxynucleotidase YfbR-like HD superfamily hydrolase